jgi:gamma-glutamylcyclotransferase (GGCT)/AIG2-like uncharacterized protein YtfP
VPLYAAYGSNLDPARMSARCPHSPLQGVGWLPGWRLTFGGEEYGWDGAIVTVVEDAGHQVFVALYDITEDDESRLDEWEGGSLSLYRKLRVRVQSMEGDRLAWLYVLDAFEGGLPSATTLGVISEAAAAAGAPDDYVADLRSRPCRSTGL